MEHADERRRPVPEGLRVFPEETLDAISRHRGHDDPDAERFFERGHDALDLLHQAVRCAQCDWDEVAGTTIPATDFSGGRRLALLALLRSERSFRRGDDRAGLEDLAAVMTLDAISDRTSTFPA